MKISMIQDKHGNKKNKVTIHSYDLWDGDVTLAQVIYPFLKKYRNLYNGKDPICGYPAEFAPDPLRPEGPDNPDHFNEWLICLDKMIYAFEWMAKGDDLGGPESTNFHKAYAKALRPYRKELEKLQEEDNKRFAAIKPNTALNSLEWDRRSAIVRPIFEQYEKSFKAHDNKIREGLDLFAKYYRSLWT